LRKFYPLVSTPLPLTSFPSILMFPPNKRFFVAKYIYLLIPTSIMEVIYNSLRKEFGLKDNHIAIIKELETKNLSAENVCRLTAIPTGRIYEYLNLLVEKGIVKKSAKRPFMYSIPDLKRSVVRFTQNRIDEMTRSQSEIMYQLRQVNSQAVDVVTNAMVFTQNHINMALEGSVFKVMCIKGSFPYILYPRGFDDFVRIRGIVTKARTTISRAGQDMAHLIHKAYQETLDAGNRLIVILDRAAFDFHMKLFHDTLGKEEFVAMLNDVIEKLMLYDAKVYVVDEHNPLQMDVSEKRVCLSLRYLGVTTGITIESEEAVRFFSLAIEEKIKNAQDVLPMLKKIFEGAD
jgi:hypothetical protein